MKLNLSTSHAADLLYRDEFAGWSYAGAHAICEYLEQLDEDMQTHLQELTTVIPFKGGVIVQSF